MPWNTLGLTAQIANIKIPPNGAFTVGYFKFKIEFHGCDITLQYETENRLALPSGSTSRTESNAQIQYRITDDLTASFHPNQRCINTIRSRFVSSGRSLVRDFGNRVLHCIGLKYKLQIAEGVDLEFSASPDTDLCFFGTQFAVQYTTDPHRRNIAGQEYRFRFEIQANASVRFGLTPQGWAQLFRWVGTRALSLVSRVSGAASRVVACLTVTTAVIVVGTIIGTALLVYGMAALISDARYRGQIWGNAIAYATGYIDALSGPEMASSGYQRAIDRYSGPPARINGYVDAIHNAMQYGYRRTRLNLLATIGMNGVLDAEGSDGRRYLYSFGGGRFPDSTRNNLIGAFEYYIRFRRRREQSVPIYIR